jgi:hypothetical protein
MISSESLLMNHGLTETGRKSVRKTDKRQQEQHDP